MNVTNKMLDKARELRAKGATVETIAKELGVSFAAARQVLQHLLVALQEDIFLDQALLRIDIDAQLQYDIEQCSEAWRASKEAAGRVVQTVDADGDRSQRIESINREGNVAYMRMKTDLIILRMRLHGLGTEDRVNPANTTLPLAAALEREAQIKKEEYEAYRETVRQKSEQESAGDTNEPEVEAGGP